MERYLIDLPVQRVLFCFQVLVLLGAGLLAWRPRWLVTFLIVCAISLTGYVVVQVFGYQAPPSNYSHYYLGAKYRIGYQDFYRVVLAGRGEPMLNHRDLLDYRLVNNSPQEAREYFLELLDRFDVHHHPDAGWRRLMDLCVENDLFRRHARLVLSEAGYSEERQRQLAADVAAANINIRDCGFNGSPFYVLARQLDPVLRFPLSIHSFRASALVEIALLALACVLLAKAFHLGTTGILLSYAIILASWDFYDWVLTGLLGMLWFVPVAGALFLLSRERGALAGVMCAVATLLKVFPGLLLLPAVVSLMVGRVVKKPAPRPRWEVAFLGAAAGAGLALAIVAQTQMDWFAWVEKIRAQFMSGAFFAPNDIAFAKTWHHGDLDFPGSRLVGQALVWLARALLVVFLVLLFRRRRDGVTLALGGLAVLTMLPWVSVEYLQYYTFPIALTLVFLHAGRRPLFFVLVPLFLVNQAMIDFPRPTYVEDIRFLVWPKTLYYYVAPLFFLYFLGSPERAVAIDPEPGVGSIPSASSGG